MKLYRDCRDESAFYSRTGSSVLHWEKQDSGWVAARATLPDDALQIEFDGLPDDLREEVIAAAVRAQAVGMGGTGEGV